MSAVYSIKGRKLVVNDDATVVLRGKPGEDVWFGRLDLGGFVHWDSNHIPPSNIKETVFDYILDRGLYNAFKDIEKEAYEGRMTFKGIK